jgi:hypothetical protein
VVQGVKINDERRRDERSAEVQAHVLGNGAVPLVPGNLRRVGPAKASTGLLICAACFVSPGSAQPSEQTAITSRIARDTSDNSHMLAVAASPDRCVLGVLYTQAQAGTTAQRLKLLSFATRPLLQPPATVALDLGPLRGSGDRVHRAGLAIDVQGRAFVALSVAPGGLLLASANPRNPAAVAATRAKTIPLGAGRIDVTRLLIAKNGILVVSGSVDGKGFIAALTTDGNLIWTRSLDAGVREVLDLVEVDEGWVWVGIVPTRFAAGSLRVGQLDRKGNSNVSPIQLVDAETRFARLSSSAGTLGLVYERLRSDGMSSEVYVEVFRSLERRESQRRLIFEGDLNSGFAITAASQGFVVSGVVDGGVLMVDRVGGDLALSSTLRTAVKAPEYRRYHGVEIVEGQGHYRLAAMESTASGRTQKLELAVSRLEAR